MKPNIPGIIPLFVLLIICSGSCKKEDKVKVPTVVTTEINGVTDSSAFGGGNVTDDGGMTVTSRGVCWSTDIQPTISDDKSVNGAGAGSFTSTINGLIAGTTYYVKAYAINSAGTGYGMAMSFKTLGSAPIASTEDATEVEPYKATLNGVVNSNYLSTVVSFEYGETTSYGQTITASQSPVTGNNNINVSAELTGLIPGKTYHYRLKTVNELGTAYGNDKTFKTLGQIATLTTEAASDVLFNTVILNGVVNPNYLSTTVSFEYGITTSYGLTAEATGSPITGNESKSVSKNLNGLMAEKTYHFRIKAVNDLGTSYGNDMTFSTKSKPTDYEGNKYNVVTIGNQIWMAENLKSTIYNNGDTIPFVSDSAQWRNLSTPGYCWYLNDESTYKNPYGALYNWFPVNTNKLCPTGWHVATDGDWTTLITYLGGENIAGGKLKEMGTDHWLSTDASVTNETGFSAVGSGWRYFNSQFYYNRRDGRFWSATQETSSNAWCRSFLYNTNAVARYNNDKNNGFSVRCVKD